MRIDPPVCEDRPIWDVWLSVLWLPSLTVADELEVFESLAREGATASELAARLDFDLRGVDILLGMLAALGFLTSHQGRYEVTPVTRTYLLHASQFYWGGVFAGQRRNNPLHATIRGAVTRKDFKIIGQSAAEPPVEMWESGEMSVETARGIAAFMHSHSLAAASGLALGVDFTKVKSLLDVGGGSGCFAITLAKQNPHLRCTVLDLPAMCEVAREYVQAGGVEDRVSTHAANMFTQDWPSGHDALLFSNILHDWGPETNDRLIAKACAALPSGGSIYLHEMLLDDSGTGPRTTAAFSVLMLANTRGRQFTFAQLKATLEKAGFVAAQVIPTYSYYSVVRAVKR